MGGVGVAPRGGSGYGGVRGGNGGPLLSGQRLQRIHIVRIADLDGHAEQLFDQAALLILCDAPVAGTVDVEEVARQRVTVDALRVHIQCEGRERRDLFQAEIGIYVAGNRGIDSGDVLDLAGILHFPEYRHDHALLSVHTRDIAVAVALAAVV